MENNVIDRQNKLKDLKARLREVQSSRKHHVDALKDIEAGKYYSFSAEEIVRVTAHHQDELDKKAHAIAELEAKIAPLEAQRLPIDGLPFDEVLPYFQGNNAEAARDALELVALSIPGDYWIPGASRRVRAALAPAKLSKKVRASANKQFLANMGVLFAEMDALFDRWDKTRPAPTFTSIGASPTVTATVKSFDAVKVEVCPMEYIRVSSIDPKTGKETIITMVKLLWPTGTVFGSSKYKGTKDNRQCEACGHAIKNNYNWVPLVLTDAKGTPKAMWVGRDCAETLFGIKMTGDLEVKS